MLSFLLTLVGLAVLLAAITGISSGIVLSLNQRTRGDGAFFALMWIPLFVASLGILWRDVTTFAVGAVCFLVAGAAVATRRGFQFLR